MNTQAAWAEAKAGFDWALVPTFLAALEQGSLLGAARVLGSSQPTVGRQVMQLESQLGLVLFERTGRGLLPTEAAVRLAEAARQMQAGADQLARAAGAQGQATGIVRLSASQPVAHALLPPLLARMRLALPEVVVDLVVSNEVSNLLRREADIAIRMVQPDQSSLVARRVGKVTLSACAHRDYLRRRGTPKTAADLLHHDVLANGPDGDVIQGFARWGAHVAPEAFAFHTRDISAYWEAVRQGMGIGFVADYRIRTAPDVLPILPRLNLPPIPVWLVVHREIRTSKRIRAVFDFLAQHLPAAL